MDRQELQQTVDWRRQAIYCPWCLRSHAPPVAVTAADGCPSQPDLMAALEKSLVVGDRILRHHESRRDGK